jgi:hypothetical protein
MSRLPARMRRPLALLITAVAALALAGCGQEERISRGETEGVYLDVGGLQYQVQISRQLNPSDPEDRAYLVGLPAGEGPLEPDETWFAVFLRVENDEGPETGALETAEEFEVRDTRGTVFEPIEFQDSNVFAYRPRPLARDDQIPQLDSPSAESTIQGSLLLFRMPLANLEFRPLELEIVDPAEPGRVATVDLDV